MHVFAVNNRDIFGYPKLKKLHLVYTWYIFSCHMPCLSMSYLCHKFVRLSSAGPQMKFSRKLHCGSSSAYHSTAFIKHNKIYLPPPRADSSFAPGLTPPVRAPARRRTLPARGTQARGPPASGGGGSAGVWGFLFLGGEIVPGLWMPSLRSLQPCPAPPHSTVRSLRLNSVPSQPS